MAGWIKVHRSLLEWEWYGDVHTKVLFIHLLLSANHADNKWRGIEIGRGQLWTSVKHLSEATGLSDKQIRNALKKLEKTGEICNEGASKGTMITVCKYDSYQDLSNDEGEQTGERGANKGRTKGEQGATNKNDKNDNNVKKRRDAAAPTHPLTIWINTNAPTVQKLKNPLTDSEAAELLADLNIDSDIKKTRLKDILMAMENKPDLLKKYKSANLTIRKWWKLEIDRNPITEQTQAKAKRLTIEYGPTA